MIRRPSGAPPPAARSGVLSVEAAGDLGEQRGQTLEVDHPAAERALALICSVGESDARSAR